MDGAIQSRFNDRAFQRGADPFKISCTPGKVIQDGVLMAV